MTEKKLSENIQNNKQTNNILVIINLYIYLISSFVVAVVFEVFEFVRSANFLDFILHLDTPLVGVPAVGSHERCVEHGVPLIQSLAQR